MENNKNFEDLQDTIEHLNYENAKKERMIHVYRNLTTEKYSKIEDLKEGFYAIVANLMNVISEVDNPKINEAIIHSLNVALFSVENQNIAPALNKGTEVVDGYALLQDYKQFLVAEEMTADQQDDPPYDEEALHQEIVERLTELFDNLK